MTNIDTLEEELKKLEKEKEEADRAFNSLEGRERRHLTNLQNKNAKLASHKRGRDDEITESDDKHEDSTNNMEHENTRGSKEEEKHHKRSKGISGEKQEPEAMEDEEGKQPKLTSTIVAPGSSDKKKADTTKGTDVRVRNRKMFGVLVGTLNKFKTDISQKSDALMRREKLEKEVDQKVQQDKEVITQQLAEELKEKKEKAQEKKEELRKQFEEKSQELMNLKWNTQRAHLSHFMKTEAKPCIYYRPADKATTNNHIKLEDIKMEESNEQSKMDSRPRGHTRSHSRSRSRSKSPDKSNVMQTEEKL